MVLQNPKVHLKINKVFLEIHMASGVTQAQDKQVEELLADCAAALQRVAFYRLPPALDRRLLWLSENKETLSETERQELLAAVEFAEERTIEKVQAQAVLKRLATLFPQLFPSQL